MNRPTSPRTAARLALAGLLLLPAALPFASCSPTERDFGGGEAGGTTTSTSTQVTCEPGTSSACYTGPEGTQDVGQCASGTQVCNDDGMSYGACEGEVLPAQDDCTTPEDEDCDGVAQPCASGAG